MCWLLFSGRSSQVGHDTAERCGKRLKNTRVYCVEVRSRRGWDDGDSGSGGGSGGGDGDDDGDDVHQYGRSFVLFKSSRQARRGGLFCRSNVEKLGRTARRSMLTTL